MASHIPTLLARILATTAVASTSLLACGGKTADVEQDEERSPGASSTSETSPGGGSSSGSPTTPTPPQPPTVDAGSDCTSKPVRVGESCNDYYLLPCGLPPDVDPKRGIPTDKCELFCGKRPDGHDYYGCTTIEHDAHPDDVVISCFTCIEGRRPQGYVEPRFEATVAGWLSHAAALERVSIDAFRILARELSAYGAPKTLVARASVAARDEIRHTRALEALATREGATLAREPVPHGPVRALVDIALENGVEGCIRETYGALVAGHQASHATRSDIRRVMKRVYADETTHADLAWDVHAWIMPRLDASDRARVEAAMLDALDELARGAASSVPEPLVRDLGLPSRDRATHLVRRLAAELAPLTCVA